MKKSSYSHVRGPLEGLVGPTRAVKSPTKDKLSRQLNDCGVRPLSPASLFQMLADVDEEDQGEGGEGDFQALSRENRPEFGTIVVAAAEGDGAPPLPRSCASCAPFLLLDVRATGFDALHIIDACHCPKTAFLSQDRAPTELVWGKRVRGMRLVVYDDAPLNRDAAEVAEKLALQGAVVFVLAGGLSGMRAAFPLALEGTTAPAVLAEALAAQARPLTGAEARAKARVQTVAAALGPGPVRDDDVSVATRGHPRQEEGGGAVRTTFGGSSRF
jgi:hypothetical protein